MYRITILLTSTVFILLISIVVSLAQSNLKVSGISGGDHPVAIINGQMAKEGSEIDGAKVIVIGNDFVTLKYQGEIINRKIGENIQNGQQINNPKRELICDLNDGVFGDLRVGGIFEYDKLIEFIGKQPNKDVYGTFDGDGLKYFNNGFEIYYRKTEHIGKIQIFQITIFPKEYNYDGDKYKKFTGQIVPNVGEDFRTEEIIKLFGVPSRVSSPLLEPETAEYYYMEKWGTLLFVFQKEGNLLYISLQYTV